MLKLTKKADYGLMAMKHLAEHATEGSRQRERCRRRLRHSAGGTGQDSAAPGQGWLVAVAAWHQWRLHAGPGRAQISAFEVIRAIDGPLFITSCITVRGECDQTDRCTIREPLRKVNESIEAVLKRIKISHMTEDRKKPGASCRKPADLVTIT